MTAGREMDARIAQEIFGHRVWTESEAVYESAAQVDRPLRRYSTALESAAEVMEKLKITIIPIEGEQWFAFVGPKELAGWSSPQAVLQFLEAGQFEGCGAAVGESLAKVICEAGLRAVEKRVATPVESKPEASPEAPSAPVTSAQVIAIDSDWRH